MTRNSEKRRFIHIKEMKVKKLENAGTLVT